MGPADLSDWLVVMRPDPHTVGVMIDTIRLGMHKGYSYRMTHSSYVWDVRNWTLDIDVHAVVVDIQTQKSDYQGVVVDVQLVKSDY